MPPITTPTPSLTPSVSLYLLLADTAKTSADALYTFYMSDKGSSEFAHHVWEGYYALKTDFEGLVRSLRDRGGLLFWGSPVALALANQRVSERSSSATSTVASLPASATGQGEGTL